MRRWLRCATVAVTLAAGVTPLVGGTAAATVPFLQSQRVNSLTMADGTDTFATHNALGGAFVSTTVRNQMDSALADGVADGSLSWLLTMSGLDDLSGTSDANVDVGVGNGVPQGTVDNPTTYDGTSDLDWWYRVPTDEDDAAGLPVHTLAGSFTAGTFAAGPGATTLQAPMGGVPSSLDLSAVRLAATVGTPTQPLQSTNGLPPGHLPSEEIPADLTSFETMTGGKLAGNVTALSLSNTAIPPSLAGASLSNCSQAYTLSNSLLDVIVGGCTIFGVPQIVATQPDESTPADPDASYTFATDATTKAVTSCQRNNVTAVLADCLAKAAYSLYFQFTTDRVIVQGLCPPGSYSDDGYAPCALADAGYYVAGTGSTSQTPCPAMTISAAGATSCDDQTSTVVHCTKTTVPIGVATSCTATVTDLAAGGAPTGNVGWTRAAGKGTLSSSSCALAGSGSTSTCTVTYRPAAKSAGAQQLQAAYGGDETHAASVGAISLTVIRRTSATRIVCDKTTIRHGRSTVCTAKVSDTSAGTVYPPTGKVLWSARSKYGTFSATSCLLSGTTAVRSCHVKFTTRLKIRGTISLSAAYQGDGNHKPSSRSISRTVT